MALEIFISYSREDKDRVFPFIEQLNKALGTECWIDVDGIESGDQFENVIINAIDNCKVVLFMLSDNSLKSKWTKREVYYAEDGGKRIIPVLVDGKKLRGWFKFHFGNVDYINMKEPTQKEKLIKNLKSILCGADFHLTDEKNVNTNYPPRNIWNRFVRSYRKYTIVIILAFLSLLSILFLLSRRDDDGLNSAQREAILAIPDSCFHLVRTDSLLGYASDYGVTTISAQWKYADVFHEGLV